MSTQLIPEESGDIRTVVRQRYGAVAERAGAGAPAECCSPAQSSCCGAAGDLLQLEAVAQLYEDPAVADLPAEVTDLSLGCGDPVTLASLEPGQTVLDLGSGGGIDCFLAAKKVGPGGKVIGVDMTAAMIERARANKAKLGAENVEFRLGEIEHLPVADNSVDVILSNCVINLSPDKPQVFREALRVLKPGGRLAVSDIVTDGPLPQAIKSSLSAWAGCVAGALEMQEYVAALEAAGFVEVSLTPVYWSQEMMAAAVEQLDPPLREQVLVAKEAGKTVLVMNDPAGAQIIEVSEAQADLDKAIFSAKIRARKPA
jgi:SAM-dependent methyltransferase